MAEMGLTPLQSIQAGTLNAADLLGWSDKVGTVEPGKWADLIAVDGDPLKEVTALQHVRFVMRGGEIVRNLPWAKPGPRRAQLAPYSSCPLRPLRLWFSRYSVLRTKNSVTLNPDGPVAQLDRASDRRSQQPQQN